MISIVMSSPPQKPTLRRAVQYRTCGCDSKSLAAKLSCAEGVDLGVHAAVVGDGPQVPASQREAQLGWRGRLAPTVRARRT